MLQDHQWRWERLARGMKIAGSHSYHFLWSFVLLFFFLRIKIKVLFVIIIIFDRSKCDWWQNQSWLILMIPGWERSAWPGNTTQAPTTMLGERELFIITVPDIFFGATKILTPGNSAPNTFNVPCRREIFYLQQISVLHNIISLSEPAASDVPSIHLKMKRNVNHSSKYAGHYTIAWLPKNVV